MTDILQGILEGAYALPATIWPEYVAPHLKLIAYALVLLVLAYVSGRVGKWVVTKILGKIGLKRAASEGLAHGMLKITGYRGNLVELVGDMVKWLIYILFLAVIVQDIGFPGIAVFFTQIAAYMPRFIAAILVVIVGFLVSDFFGRVFQEGGRRILKDEGLSMFGSGLIRYSIGMVIVIMALSLLGLDTVSLVVLLAAVLGSAMVILALGVRDAAPNISAGLQIKHMLKVGDKIKVAGYTGQVERMDSTSVTIRSGSRSVVIPNSILTGAPFEKMRREQQAFPQACV